MTDMTPQEILAAVEAALIEAARSVSLGQELGHQEIRAREAVKDLDSIQKDVSLNASLVSSGTSKGNAR